VKLESVSYADALQRGLKVVDSTAFSLCMDNGMRMRVFGIDGDDTITRAILGEEVGTSVHL
jgi:uridylate kinase